MPTVPVAVPTVTGTVHVAPLPVGVPSVAPVDPVPVIAKFAAVTPVTASLNVTVKLTVVAPVGFGSARVIETTFGAIT